MGLLQQCENFAQERFHLFAIHDPIHHSMVEQIFGALKSFREFLLYGLLNDPGARKSNNGSRLGQDDISKHGKTG